MADLNLAETGLSKAQTLQALYVNGTKTDGTHQEKFLRASRGESACTYIVSGDSTRQLTYHDAMGYYAYTLGKIGVSVVADCYSGMSAKEWLENVVGSAGLQHAIDNTPGTGETTILEYSFGINSSGGTLTEQEYIELGITSYLAAKPNATVVLVSPLGGTVMRQPLTDIYESVASNLTLEMVNGTIPFNDVYRNKFYMNDNTHQNLNGSKRLINYVLSELLPDKCRLSVTMDDVETTGVDNYIDLELVNGIYNTGNGNLLINSTSRAFAKVDCVAGTEYNIVHGGEAHWVTFYNSGGTFIGTVTATLVGGDVYAVTAPVDATQMGITVTNGGGVAWDDLNFMYYAHDSSADFFKYMKQPEINAGLTLALSYLGNNALDSKGNLPTTGQTPTGQSDGTWIWS